VFKFYALYKEFVLHLPEYLVILSRFSSQPCTHLNLDLGRIAMRLLQAATIKLERFNTKIPPYAILSHTWGTDEVTFQDMEQPNVVEKAGYLKIKYSCEEAVRRDLEYVWVDTCCIDKSSSAELCEAINSMFKWYEDAVECFAYLEDVHDVFDEDAFRGSRWFRRGWTLQELLAPSKLTFFSSNWGKLGTRATHLQLISSVTRIETRYLSGGDKDFRQSSIAQRMSWAVGRSTERIEDRAYSLLGIFGINMPLLYGEGCNAFARLQQEIMKNSDDQTLFAWEETGPGLEWSPFAMSPDAFNSGKDYVRDEFTMHTGPYAITNRGLELRLSLFYMGAESPNHTYAVLACRLSSSPLNLVAIPIHLFGQDLCVRRSGPCQILDRDLANHLPLRNLRFLIKSEQPLDTTYLLLKTAIYPHVDIFLRKLPKNVTYNGLHVTPRDQWDPHNRMLQVMPEGGPGEEASRFFIRIKDFLGKNLVIDVLVASSGETSATAFQESDPQPPPYRQSQFRRKFTGFKFTFGSEPIIWRDYQVVRTLDIDYTGQLEEQNGV
jgi:hypothetical protein